MTDDRAALVEKVNDAMVRAMVEAVEPDVRAHEMTQDEWGHIATAAIAIIRAEVLEESLNALYSVPRWDREIFDSLTQTPDGLLIYIEEADTAIRALEGDSNGL